MEGITVASRHKSPAAPLLFLGYCGGEKIIRFVASSLGIGEPTGADKLGKNLELLHELFIEFTTRLIGRERLMPISGFIEAVPTNEDRAWSFSFIELEKEVGEAQNCACALVARPTDGLWQCVVGTMRKGVAVDDKQRPVHNEA